MNQSLFQYLVNEYWKEVGDPRVAHLPLLGGGPFPLLLLLTGYLASIRVCNSIMKTRNAMNLRTFMVFYNSLLVVVYSITFLVAFHALDYSLKCWSCRPLNPSDYSAKTMVALYCGYVYFTLKLVELTDTIIFCLRKKRNQITFLHCFHHSVTPIFVWCAMKVHPEGMSGFTPLLNGFVHVVMHTYYGLSALGPVAAPYLWWKKYLTIFQLVQFVLIFIHAMHTLLVPNCSWPLMLVFAELTQSVFFFILFYNYYTQSYRRLKKD